MLRPTSQCRLTVVEWFTWAIQRYAVAVDTATGAWVTKSDGRCRGGLTRFILHRPDGSRREVKANSMAEAIDKFRVGGSEMRSYYKIEGPGSDTTFVALMSKVEAKAARSKGWFLKPAKAIEGYQAKRYCVEHDEFDCLSCEG